MLERIYTRLKCSSTRSLNRGCMRRDTNTISQASTRAFHRCRPHNQLFCTLAHFGHCADASRACPHLSELNMQCPAIIRFISKMDWWARVCVCSNWQRKHSELNQPCGAHTVRKWCVYLAMSYAMDWFDLLTYSEWYSYFLFHTQTQTNI